MEQVLRKGTDLVRKEFVQATLDSREVAEMLGKDHSELLKEIEGRKDGKNVGLIPVLTKGNFHLVNYFIEDCYKDKKGQRRKCYQITKMGCELIGNKQQGEKGILFTAKYVERFNEMEKSLNEPKSSLDLLELQVKSLKEVKGEVQEVRNELEEFKEDLPLIGSEPEELQSAVQSAGTKALGGYDCPAYKDKKLRAKVFQSVWKYVKDQFNVRKYKAIKRKHLSKAKEIAGNYTAPFYLQEEIDILNNQGKLDV